MDYKQKARVLVQIIEEFFDSRDKIFQEMIKCICDQMKSGHKILVFGNGGSASHAQHFSAELVNRFLTEREAIPAVSLTTDTSVLTSISNDFSFDRIFSRQIEALGNKEDVALGLSTSGKSANVIEALKTAKSKGMVTVIFTGKKDPDLDPFTDFQIDVSSEETPRIQEVHHFLLHILAEEIEKRIR